MNLVICTQIVDKDDPMLGFFHGWIRVFAEHFEQVDVICLKEGVHNFPDHVHVHSLGKEGGENRLKYVWRFYKYFWRLYVREEVDYVFYHMGAIYNILAAPFFLIRTFKRTQFYWWKTHGHINLIGRIALLFVDRVYTAVAESFPIASKKRYVVGHAIDTNLFNFEINYAINYTILFVGRISRSKRVEQVLKVARELNKRGREVGVRIIGNQIDKKYMRELRTLTKELELSDVVTFIDGVPQTELVKEYQKALVFMNPSDNDGLDKVILEAMASGAIPITANLSFQEMLSPYGLYMKKGDMKGYASCIERIYTLSQSEREVLSRELRDVVVSGHALTTLPKRIFNVT